MSGAGGADGDATAATDGGSLRDRFGSVDGWTQAGLLLGAVLVVFFLALVALSYV